MRNGKQWYMELDENYHHPALGWLKKFNVTVYYGKRKKYLAHSECKPLDINYLKSLNLKWRSSYKIVEESLDSLISQGVPFVSI